MTIIFQCKCGRCFRCRAEQYFNSPTHPSYTKMPLIVSRHVAETINSWVHDYPSTKKEASKQ